MSVIAVLLVLLLQAPLPALANGEGESAAFEALGVRSITVNADHLNVELVGDSGLGSFLGQSVRVETPFAAQGYRIEHQQFGGNLKVWVDRDPFTWTSGNETMVIHIPQGVSARIASVSGRIRVEDLAGDRFSFSSTSGRIEIRSIQGAVDASTVSGSISLDSVKGRFSARTVSGTIRGVALEPTDNVSFQSVSGSIDVRFSVPLEDLRFELSSVSGAITADRIRAARGLRFGSGDVLVTGRTISGSQVYR